MPIYEYICPKCDAEFEKLVSNSDEKVSCDNCGSKKLTRKLSVFSASVAKPSFKCPSSGAPCGGGCDAAPKCPMSGGCGF